MKNLSELSPAENSVSKIPRYNPKSGKNMQNMESQYQTQRPSRLLQMQQNYQQKLMREKQEKLVQMYEDSQQQTMSKLQAKGLVRDFFAERRTLEARSDVSQMPSINQHYKQRKYQPQNYNEPWVERQGPRQNSYSKMYKNSAGRDRGNPLAPIERKPVKMGKENNVSAPPIPRKPQRHGRPWTKESQREGGESGSETMPKSAPLPQNYRYSPAGSNDSTPPPNLAQLKAIQKQKLHMKKKNTVDSRARPPKAPPQQKMTEFQKWQMEQDNARAERLKQYGGGRNDDFMDEDTNTDSGLDSDEKDEVQAEIERKQKELLAKIAEQEAELERIRMERQQEEEEERKEMERRKRKEEERRRKLKEEEEHRRMLEIEAEERQRREEEEEEFKRKLMKVDRIPLNDTYTKKKNVIQYESSDDDDEMSHYNRPDNRSRSQYNQADSSRTQKSHYGSRSQYDQANSSRTPKLGPTPPPQPKPARVNRKPPNRRSPPVQDFNNSHAPRPSKTDTSMFDQAARDPDAYESENVTLLPCSNCGRKFASDRLQKHRNACGNLTKKRKVMDPSKMRVEGTDMAKYQNSAARQKTPKSKPSNWRKKHEEFVQNIRYARQVAQVEKEGGSLSNLPPPPKTDYSDFVQCPWCSRKFNESAAERHIPRCKDLKTRPPPMKRR